MKPNTLTIRHQDGDCVYDVESVMLNVDANGLDLEISTKENPDCVLGFLPAPSLYVESGTISVSTAAELQSEKLQVSSGWDTEDGEKEDNIFRIYIGQHQALDNNILTLERTESGQVQIYWVSDSVDFNYYDDRAKRNELELSAVYVD